MKDWLFMVVNLGLIITWHVRAFFMITIIISLKRGINSK